MKWYQTWFVWAAIAAILGGLLTSWDSKAQVLPYALNMLGVIAVFVVLAIALNWAKYYNLRRKVRENRKMQKENAYFQDMVATFADEIFTNEYFRNPHCYYLGPDGKTRKVGLNSYIWMSVNMPYEDRPKCILIEATSANSVNQGYFLRFSGGRQYWQLDGYLMDSTPSFITLKDLTGAVINITLTGEWSERIGKLLSFVTYYRSVDDYTIKVLAAVGAPLIHKTKDTMGGSFQLCELRVALEEVSKGSFLKMKEVVEPETDPTRLQLPGSIRTLAGRQHGDL